MSTVITQLPARVTSATHVLAQDRKAQWLNSTSLQILDLVEQCRRNHKGKIDADWATADDLRHKIENETSRVAHFERDREDGLAFSDETLASNERLKLSIKASKAKLKELGQIKHEAVLNAGDVEAWLGNLSPNVKLRQRPVEIQLKKGQAEYDFLLATREEIALLAKKRDQTLRAPLTHAEAKEAALADIRRKAKKGEPKVGGLFRYSRTLSGQMRQGQIAWPETNITREEFWPRAQDGIDFLCWLFFDEIAKRIEQKIDERKHDNPLSRDARSKRISETDVAILDLEYREVELTRRLLLAGDARVSFRAGLNPLAVLQVEVTTNDDDDQSFDFEGEEE